MQDDIQDLADVAGRLHARTEDDTTLLPSLHSRLTKTSQFSHFFPLAFFAPGFSFSSPYHKINQHDPISLLVTVSKHPNGLTFRFAPPLPLPSPAFELAVLLLVTTPVGLKKPSSRPCCFAPSIFSNRVHPFRTRSSLLGQGDEQR
jgi:hypothetical protein